MAFQSPYRGEETPLSRLSPRARECISRLTMLFIGLTLIYFSTRGLIRLYEALTESQAPPAQGIAGSRVRRGFFPWLIWLSVIVVDLIGVATVVAAVLPVGLMQALFERFNEPPVTGDRGMTDANWRASWWRWW